MPTYEYQCTHCGAHLEILQRMNDARLVECPTCHQAALQRLISRSSFVLKGSGWYKDGYGTGSATDKASSDQTGEASTDSATTKKVPK